MRYLIPFCTKVKIQIEIMISKKTLFLIPLTLIQKFAKVILTLLSDVYRLNLN